MNKTSRWIFSYMSSKNAPWQQENKEIYSALLENASFSFFIRISIIWKINSIWNSIRKIWKLKMKRLEFQSSFCQTITWKLVSCFSPKYKIHSNSKIILKRIQQKKYLVDKRTNNFIKLIRDFWAIFERGLFGAFWISCWNVSDYFVAIWDYFCSNQKIISVIYLQIKMWDYVRGVISRLLSELSGGLLLSVAMNPWLCVWYSYLLIIKIVFMLRI